MLIIVVIGSNQKWEMAALKLAIDYMYQNIYETSQGWINEKL